MADDTNPEIQPMDFHCCDTPRGMLYYHMEDLTATQQAKLNELKLKTVRDDEQYLAAHPEIRACVALITRHVLKRRPRNNLHDTIAQFFTRSKLDIEEEIKEYISQRKGHTFEGDSAVGLYVKSASSDSSFEDMSTFSTEQEKFSDSLKNIEINLNEVFQVPSGTVISSISEITDTGLYQSGELEKFTKIINSQLIEDMIVSDILDRIPYEDELEEEEGYDEMDLHIPVSGKVSFSPVVRSFPKLVNKDNEVVDKSKVQASVDEIIDTERILAEEDTKTSEKSSKPLVAHGITPSDDTESKEIDNK